MAETKQITATIPNSLVEWIEMQPERGLISFSKTIEVLLKEAKEFRENGGKNKKVVVVKGNNLRTK